jgi:hypothetical protein
MRSVFEKRSILEKLNLKNQRRIAVLNAPATFGHQLTALGDVTVLREMGSVDEIDFLLAFVTKEIEVETIAKALAKAAKGDAVVWFAYPKGTSRKYKSEINRDHGWQVLGELGFEGVRGIAIDEDWSALRFRRLEFIKDMKRDPKHAMTTQGRARLAKQ